jgi:ribosomal protein L22
MSTDEPDIPAEDVEPSDAEGAEAASSSEAPRSAEAEAPTADESTRGASAEDAPSRPHGDELEEAVEAVAGSPEEEEAQPGVAAADEEPEGAAEDEPEARADDEEADGGESEAATEAPARRRRRPSRRRSAEPEPEAAEEEPPAKPAPTRRRAQRDPNLPPPVVRAEARYVRSSARKARLVCDHIRGKSVEEARAILALTPRAIARDWSKLLESAVANAEHNHELVGEDLYVKAIKADEGPTIKRFRPRAMGRATRIRKRTSHLTILLTPKD